MDIVYADRRLARLATDAEYTAGLPREVVLAFRRRVQFIFAAPDERSFYGMKSLHYERLKGDRKDQHSMRLNNQFRLILRVRSEESSGREGNSSGVHKKRRTAVLIEIVDYH